MRQNSSWVSDEKIIPISKEFSSAALRLPNFFFKADPEEDFDYAWDAVKLILQLLRRKADKGVLITASGELHLYVREEMKNYFGTYWFLCRKPESLLVRDFRLHIRKNGPINYAWASFDLLSDGSVTWTAHTPPHDPGLPPPDQKVHVSLP